MIGGAMLSLAAFSPGHPIPVYKNKNAPVETRVADLLSRMTLKEKILQLNQYTLGNNNNVNNVEMKLNEMDPRIGSYIYFNDDPVFRNSVQKRAMENSRLGIPILFGADVIHGFRTIYPIPLAVACSWNPDLSGEACRIAAKEARLSGVDWTFSPMIDIGRDPRWGRVAEGYGEDPYANAVFGAAAVKAYQGKRLSDPYSVLACLKHYVGYGVSEGGRDYRYTDISPQALWETYLVPYQAGIEAGAATVMSAFNDISGIPATANHYTLTDILKNRWQHQGFVVADWRAVEQLISQGVARDKQEATQKALMAGVDMDMLDNLYLENLEQLIKEKKVPLSRVDDAVKRILRVKFMLGLFDRPYAEVLPEKERYLNSQSRETSARLAAESMVLLKNKEGILPLSVSRKKIALIGPLAKDSLDLMGSWSSHGSETDVESIVEGMVKEFNGKGTIKYARGCDFEGNDQSGFNEAVQIAGKSDVVVICLGEKKTWSGENASRSTIALPQIQRDLLAKLKSTGKPVVLVLSNGRPLELAEVEPNVEAILEAWQPGTSGGDAIAGILSGRINPSGKLAITFPLTTGQIPVYYNMRQSARPYREMGNYQDLTVNPQYWFGYGLSYTTFSYGKVSLSAPEISRNQHLTASITVSNTGGRAGKEAVLWYISDRAASISRPLKELKHFEKRAIAPGEKQIFRFEIDPLRDLSFPDSNGKRLLEAGEYELHVGDQTVTFKLK